ncbi:DUF7344 domain-containing protein [Halogranum rubrum]
MDKSTKYQSSSDIPPIFDNKRRQHVARYLLRNGGEGQISEIADQVAAWENGAPIKDLSSGERKQVYVALHQTHLPRLEEENILKFDQDSGEVRLNRHNLLDMMNQTTGSSLFNLDTDSPATSANAVPAVVFYSSVISVLASGTIATVAQGGYRRLATYLLPVLICVLFVTMIVSSDMVGEMRSQSP